MSLHEHLHLPRKLFGSEPSNHSCPWAPGLDQAAAEPLFGHTSFHQFNIYLSGACAVLSTIIIFALMFLHGTHFSRPREQRKIIKIMSLVPTYSLFCWLSTRYPLGMPYIQPWLDVLQSICLATFFLLMNEFISDGTSEREMFFAALDIPSRKDRRTKETTYYDTAESRLGWYRKKWIAIFQYPVVSVLVAIASNITQAVGVYCEFSSEPYYAHLWLSIVANVSVSMAVLAIFNLYTATKKQLAHHKPLLKLICFKIIVGFAFLVSIIFLILNGVDSGKALAPTPTLSYGDIKSIPDLLENLLMVPIAIFFWFAYPWQEYKLGVGHNPIRPSNETVPIENREYQGGFLGWKAYVLAASPMEVLRGIKFTFNMASEHRDSQSQNTYSEGLLPTYHKQEQTSYSPQQYTPPQQYPQQQYPPRSVRDPSPYRDGSPYRHGDYNTNVAPPARYDPIRGSSPDRGA